MDMKQTLRCGECGTDFERPGSRGPIPTRCPECRKAARRVDHAGQERRRQERRKAGSYQCGRCGETKPGADFARSQRKNGRWCRECYREMYVERSGGLEVRSCEVCGDEFEVVKRSRRRYCSDRCKGRAPWARARAERPARNCKQCGEPIGADKRSNALYCSETCAGRYRVRRSRERYKQHSERSKLKGYGLTPESYAAMLEAQGGKCAICGVEDCPTGRAMAVDHDHKTGKVRGILCSKCNHGIGQFNDDPALLTAAIDYLT